MTFVSPLTGLLLGSVVVPLLLLLYFLRLRRQSLQVSSTMLWERAVEDLHANTPFQRLRPSTLLVLQLCALLFVILAIMQPQIEGGLPDKGTHVILIDRSGSMTTEDVRGVTRLDEAKDEAIDFVHQIHGGGLFSGRGGETMVIAFSDHATVVSPFTDSVQQLTRAIQSIEPTHGASEISESLILARAYTTNVNPEQDGIPSSDSAKIELFSDGRISDLSNQALQRGESIRYHMVGLPDTKNIGIATIDAKRSTESSDEVQVFLSLLNTYTEKKTVDIELQINSVPVSVQQVTIPPSVEGEIGIATMVFVPFSITGSGTVTARIMHEDALLIDNQASLVISPAKELKVLLAENGAPMLRTVLEGMPLAELKVVSAELLNQKLQSGETSNFDVIVTRDVKLSALPQGAFLIFGQPPPIPAFDTYVSGEPQVMLVAREEHPVMRFVRYEEIIVTEGYEVVLTDVSQPLLEGSHWAAVMEYRGEGSQIIYAAFDPMQSNWPYLRSFPFFVYNSVQYLGHRGEQVAENSKTVGKAISEHGLQSEFVEVIEPDGSLHTVKVDNQKRVSWGPIRLTGIHAIQSELNTVSVIAVNTSVSESDIASREDVSIGATEVNDSGEVGSSYIQLWPWALGAVLVVLLIEWWVYQKKVSVPQVPTWANASFKRDNAP